MNSYNAGFTRRFFASLLDSMILLDIELIPLVLLVNGVNSIDVESFPPISLLVTYIIVLVFTSRLINILYRTYLTSRIGGTLGQLLYGMNVVSGENDDLIDFKTAFLRNTAGHAFSMAFLGLGYLAIIKHPDKLSWHDQLFDTKVIKVRSPVLGIVVYIVSLFFLVFMISLVGNAISFLLS